jgi:hypothetical protein
MSHKVRVRGAFTRMLCDAIERGSQNSRDRRL